MHLDLPTLNVDLHHQIQHNLHPWTPQRDSKNLLTIDYWDRPISGVTEFKESQFHDIHLYHLMYGVIGNHSTWLLTPLISTEFDKFLALDPAGSQAAECKTLTDEILQSRPGLILFCDSPAEYISGIAYFDPTVTTPNLSLHEAFLQRLYGINPDDEE